MAAIRHFLLVFDHVEDVLLQQLDFGNDLVKATEEYSRLEHEFSHNQAIDIVLVGSDSIETVKVTHSNYFAGRSKTLMDRALNLVVS